MRIQLVNKKMQKDLICIDSKGIVYKPRKFRLIILTLFASFGFHHLWTPSLPHLRIYITFHFFLVLDSAVKFTNQILPIRLPSSPIEDPDVNADSSVSIIGTGAKKILETANIQVYKQRFFTIDYLKMSWYKYCYNLNSDYFYYFAHYKCLL